MPRLPDVTPSLKPDAKELILGQDTRYMCETYMFEPSPEETALGYMYAAGEIEDRGGVGKELLDLVVSAVQKEYYRDPKRSPASSFELALHQANLILHDSVEQDIRDWMGYFHVAIAVLVGNILHISVAGGASVQLCRKSTVTEVSTGLAHFPITNPLRTFSQLASGAVAPRDTIFLSTLHFSTLYRPEDLAHFAIEHSATTITARLQQLYADQSYNTAVAVVTVSVLPKYIVSPREEVYAAPLRIRDHANTQQQNLAPRRPLIIHRTGLASTLFFLVQLIGRGWRSFLAHVWPHIKRGGAKGGQALVQVSKTTSQNVKTLTSSLRTSRSVSLGLKKTSVLRLLPARLSIPAVKTWPGMIWAKIVGTLTHLPSTSKIFAVIALVLLVALAASLVLLHKKRVTDQEIQHASELLHEAITKKDAAEAALVYNNRDQAALLLKDAEGVLTQLRDTTLYQAEGQAVAQQITVERDRMQKITRTTPDQVRVVGDFASGITKKPPHTLFFVNGQIYTFNPDNNAILSMDTAGTTAVATANTQGIGFFTAGSGLTADKTLLLTTAEPGLALFDATTNTIQKQAIEALPKDTVLSAIAPFGNRLYIYDTKTKNILSFSKTLRGYSGGTAWITDATFPKDSIRSLAVDGTIFTLHADGTIRRLFKGVATEFKQEAVEPLLNNADKIVTSENLRHLYVLDTSRNRIVIFNKKGALIRQIFFETPSHITDFALDDQEINLYVLDGTKVVAVPVTAEDNKK